MIYLALAILSSTAVALVMRISGSRVQNRVGMLAANYAGCTALAALFAHGFLPQGEGSALVTGLSVLSGALYLGSFLLLQWNTRENGVVLSSTFMKLGVMVPTVMAVVVFHEAPKPLQTAGFLLALAAIVMIRPAGESGAAKNALALAALLIGGGMTDGMSKIFEAICRPELKEYFLVLTFACALLLCAVLMGVNAARAGRFRMTPVDAAFGLLIGVPNYFSSRFLLLSLSSVPASVAYPTYSVATIVLVTLAGVAFFKEKLTRRQCAALGVILVSLAMLNL